MAGDCGHTNEYLVHKRLEISSLAERLLVLQEEPCSMELVRCCSFQEPSLVLSKAETVSQHVDTLLAGKPATHITTIQFHCCRKRKEIGLLLFLPLKLF
jgi:hypothetical protein